MKKKKKAANTDRITRIFELPYEIDPHNARIIMTGNTDIFIENHQGIVKYTDKEVTVKTACFAVVIAGRGLLVKAMGRESIVVSGFIACLKFETEGR